MPQRRGDRPPWLWDGRATLHRDRRLAGVGCSPSPDGHSVALVEYSCSSYYSGPRLTVRDLTTGSSHVVTQDLSPCGLESDVTWNPSSTKLVFAYGTHLNLDNLPAGC